MSRKLALSPDVSYMLGLCTIGKEEPSISVSSPKYEVIERFVRIALQELGIDPRKVIVTDEGESKKAMFYNSMLKKLMTKSLEGRERIFKYKNEYSGSYFAGMFDARGKMDKRSVWSGTRDMKDMMVLVKLGFQVTRKGKIGNPNTFLEFIKPYSASL